MLSRLLRKTGHVVDGAFAATAGPALVRAVNDERQEAADDLVAANAAADKAVGGLDDQIAEATDEIERVGALLVEAQEQRSALMQRRRAAEQERLDTVRPLTAMLQATAPGELRDFISELRWFENSAKFQTGVGRPAQPIQNGEDFFDQQLHEAELAKLNDLFEIVVAFGARVCRALPVAQAAIFQPDIDAAALIARLRREIGPVPPAIDRGWQDARDHQLRTGRGQ